MIIGRWINPPATREGRRAAASLYLALMADAALDLIGSCGRLLVQGRFAEDELFVRALALLRPDQQVFTSHAQDDVCYGAMRLLGRTLAPPAALTPVVPLPVDLSAYRDQWLHSGLPPRNRLPSHDRRSAITESGRLKMGPPNGAASRELDHGD